MWASCADITLVAPSGEAEVASLAAARAAAEVAMQATAFTPAPFQPVRPRPMSVADASPIDQPYGYPVNNGPCDLKDIATAQCSFGLVIEERFPVSARRCRTACPAAASVSSAHALCSHCACVVLAGCSQYANGPSLWPTDPWGAYAMVTNAPGAFEDDRYNHDHTRCPKIPLDSPLAPRASELDPYAMYNLNGLAWCLLACNKTQIMQTGDDPCAAGSIDGSAMACYDLGSELLSHDPTHMGACGYNCTLLRHDVVDAPTTCSEQDEANGLCQVYCDSRTFPGAKN